MNQRQRKLLVKMVQAQSEKKRSEVETRYWHEIDLINELSRADSGVTAIEVEINKAIKAINKKLAVCRDLVTANSKIRHGWNNMHPIAEISEYKVTSFHPDAKWADDALAQEKLRTNQLEDIAKAENATILAVELAGSEAEVKTVLSELNLSLDGDLGKVISALL